MSKVVNIDDYRAAVKEEETVEECYNLKEETLRVLDLPYLPELLEATALTQAEHYKLARMRLFKNWAGEGKYPKSEEARKFLSMFENNMVFLYRYVEAVLYMMDTND